MTGKIVKKILISSLFFLLVLVSWFHLELNAPLKVLPKKLLVEIQRGESVQKIAMTLKEKGIIRKRLVFLLAYKLLYPRESLKAGEYEFILPLSLKDFLNKLIEGKVYLHPLVIPEGLTRGEIAELLESMNFFKKEEFLEATLQTQLISSLDTDALDLEGYLFPDTYFVPKGISAFEFASMMVSQFKTVFNEDSRRRTSELRMTTREIVTLASLIEKETSLPEEKKLISSVFHNRLRRGMKLDCDPTIIYFLKKEGKYKNSNGLKKKDLSLDNPYNTYIYPGLPPSPICNPGRDSLQAALFPSNEQYLYFVSKNDGSHHFSQTYPEHQRAVQKYQKRFSLSKGN